MLSINDFCFGLSVSVALGVVVHNHFFAFPTAMRATEKNASLKGRKKRTRPSDNHT